MKSTHVRLVAVTELAINLVTDEVEVVLLNKVTQLHELLVGIEGASGVIGVTDHDGACALVDELLKLLDRGQCIAVLNLGGDGAHVHAHLASKAHIVGIHRFGHDELVARVEAGEESKLQRLATTTGNDDVACIELDVVAAVVAHELVEIALVTL